MDAFKLIETWEVDSAAAGVVGANGLARTYGEDFKPFELASVTKAMFSLAVLVAIEEGSLDVNQPAGPPGSTIGNLLSHSSGLAMRAGESGYSTVAKPGLKRIYSNQGFDVLAASLEQATQMKAADYFNEAVVQPLGLQNTEIYGSVAFAGRSSVTDLLTFGQELLNPTIISTQTLRQATTAHLPALDGVLPGFGKQKQNSWGLGFEIKGTKPAHWTAGDNSPGTFGHFGQTGTFIWIDPLAELCCVALTDRPFGEWATTAWPAFSQAVLDEIS